MKFYAVCLKGFHEGVSRWSVYRLKCDGSGLEKMWPKDPSDEKQAKKDGWTYVARNSKYPAYHFCINEIGSSHLALLKERICCVLENERGLKLNPDNLDLEVLQ